MFVNRERWAFAALAVLAILLWRDAIGDAIQRGAWEAERVTLEGRADSARSDALLHLKVTERAVHERDEARRTRDSTERVLTARLQNGKRAEVVAVQQVAEAGATVDETVDSIRTVLPTLGDSLKNQISVEREAHQSLAESLREQTRALATLYASERTYATSERLRGDSWETQAGKERARAEASEALGAALAKRLDSVERPGLLTKARRAVVPLAIGIVAGVLLSR